MKFKFRNLIANLQGTPVHISKDDLASTIMKIAWEVLGAMFYLEISSTIWPVKEKINFQNLIVHLHDTPIIFQEMICWLWKLFEEFWEALFLCKDRYFRKLLFAKVKSFQYLITHQQESIISQDLISLMHKMIAL